jgi:hypothetical protein
MASGCTQHAALATGITVADVDFPSSPADSADVGIEQETGSAPILSLLNPIAALTARDTTEGGWFHGSFNANKAQSSRNMFDIAFDHT